MLISLLAPAGAAATVSCSYVRAGPPGPAGNLLSIAATEEEVDAVAIARDGDRIAVSDDRTITPVQCTGDIPTVTDVDSIEFSGETGTALTIDERNGPLAPGVTDEGDGGSEIELDLEWAGNGFLAINGQAGGNSFRFGATPGRLGLDLNSDLGAPDLDAVLGGVDFVVGRGGAGRDTLVARGGAGFAGPFARDIALEGKGGRDHLIGGPLEDDLNGGKGRDRIDARDHTRDEVDCGGGKDRVEADRRDELDRCERVRR